MAATARPQAFVNGLHPGLWVGVAVLAAGALIVLALPFRTRAAARGRRNAPPPSEPARASREPESERGAR